MTESVCRSSGQRRAGGLFALANFAVQFRELGLRGLAITAFQLPQILLQVRKLFDDAFDFLGELLPLRKIERNLADGQRYCHAGARQLALPFAAQLLVAERDWSQLLGNLDQLLVLDGRSRPDRFLVLALLAYAALSSSRSPRST